MAPLLDGPDMVSAYIEAERAEGACLGVPGKIREMDIPSQFSGEEKKQLRSALESCETMGVNRYSAAQSIKRALDGDSSVSTLADIKQSSEQVQTHAMLCAGAIVAIAVQHGATKEELGLD